MESREICDIYKTDGVQAFLLDIKDLDRTGTVVGSITKDSNKIPSKSFDFSDVLSESRAQELPNHGLHKIMRLIRRDDNPYSVPCIICR